MDFDKVPEQSLILSAEDNGEIRYYVFCVESLSLQLWSTKKKIVNFYLLLIIYAISFTSHQRWAGVPWTQKLKSLCWESRIIKDYNSLC